MKFRFIGAVTFTDNAKLQQECGLQSLGSRRRTQVVRFTNKIRSCEKDPIGNQVIHTWNKNIRLKRSSTLQFDETIRQQIGLEHNRAVGSLVVRASDSKPEGLGSMPDATKHPPSTHGFTCRNCGGGDRGRVAIYRPFGEFHRAKIALSPVWCSRPTTGVPLAHATMNFVGLDLTTSDSHIREAGVSGDRTCEAITRSLLISLLSKSPGGTNIDAVT
ncbi:hypothetical protein TNCV_662081 [Trichonephila clavipes]|nr:hypothetical protein TNCV_662081 [Trichonephila clavipes]